MSQRQGAPGPSENHAWFIWNAQHRGPATISYASKSDSVEASRSSDHTLKFRQRHHLRSVCNPHFADDRSHQTALLPAQTGGISENFARLGGAGSQNELSAGGRRVHSQNICSFGIMRWAGIGSAPIHVRAVEGVHRTVCVEWLNGWRDA